jgi:hypothetical protein
MRLSQRFGASSTAEPIGSRDFSKALLPAERRGWRIFGCPRRVQARRFEGFELGLSFGGGSPRSLVFACGASAPCCLTIASEERETWAAGSLRGFGRRVGFQARAWGQIRGLGSEETTDGHVSAIHRASKEARRTAVRRAAWFSIEADVLELVKIQCSPEH